MQVLMSCLSTFDCIVSIRMMLSLSLQKNSLLGLLLFLLLTMSSDNECRASSPTLSLGDTMSRTYREELDAFWSQAVTVVEAGDFETYASMYHPDAVLVQSTQSAHSGSSSGITKPISQALVDWKPGFAATKAGEQTVKLAFRFQRRIHGSTTAHETGIFCYQCTKVTGDKNENGSESSSEKIYLHFESLLVKKPNMGWLWMMEYQKHAATRAEWDLLKSLDKQSGSRTAY